MALVFMVLAVYHGLLSFLTKLHRSGLFKEFGIFYIGWNSLSCFVEWGEFLTFNSGSQRPLWPRFILLLVIALKPLTFPSFLASLLFFLYHRHYWSDYHVSARQGLHGLVKIQPILHFVVQIIEIFRAMIHNFFINPGWRSPTRPASR